MNIQGLVKAFGGSVVVDHVDLHVEEGEFVSLLGPSGCGKTTTLRCVAGLESPDGGDIHIDGKPVVQVRPEKRDIGMVFQSYALWPHMTVHANVAYPLRMRRVPRAEIRTRVGEALDLVDLGRFASRSVAALSGGQQQRVALARAIVARPRVLLFDEPLSNLDAKLRASMRREIGELHRRVRTTSIYVTHDQLEALTLSDRVVVMNAGRVHQVGPPREVYSRPADAFVADFVGFDNLLRGVAVEQQSGRWLVQVPGFTGPIGCAGPASVDVAAGGEVTVAVRANDVELVGESHASNTVQGKIVEVSYQGDQVEYVVKVGPGVIKARVAASRDLAGGGRRPGDPATVHLPADKLLPLTTSTDRAATEEE